MGTEDLLVLRSSIYSYLKTKKLKKRNSKYMDVYIRINKELSLRNAENKSKENPKKEEKQVEETKTNSFSAQKLFEFFETQKVKDEEILLKQKTKNSSGFDIPNFFNDKTSEIKKKKEILKLKDDIILCKEYKENSNSYLNNNCSEFGKGLFNEKYDLDLSEEDSPFIRSRKNTTDVRDSFNLIMDKELEITEAIFDPMPEECFLCLD